MTERVETPSVAPAAEEKEILLDSPIEESSAEGVPGAIAAPGVADSSESAVFSGTAEATTENIIPENASSPWSPPPCRCAGAKSAD